MKTFVEFTDGNGQLIRVQWSSTATHPMARVYVKKPASGDDDEITACIHMTVRTCRAKRTSLSSSATPSTPTNPRTPPLYTIEAARELCARELEEESLRRIRMSEPFSVAPEAMAGWLRSQRKEEQGK